MASEADPKDLADMLGSLAGRVRADPAMGRATAKPASPPFALVPGDEDADPEGPSIGSYDVFIDERNITVTLETRNADAASVHVSLLAGRLLIGLGEGPLACKRDLPLPERVDEEAAVATFRNGILDVVMPRRR